MGVRVADFHYDLPPDRIAQHPTPERDQSRLLVLDRGSRRWRHQGFRDLSDWLRPGDLLVLNDSRVMAARLRGRKAGSGGEIEVLLAEAVGVNDWWVMLRPGKRVRAGTVVEFPDRREAGAVVRATVTDKSAEGLYRVRFEQARDIVADLPRLGEVPLPPYITRDAGGPDATDAARYQTVYAGPPGSVAAPTAGLHFTTKFLDGLRRRGIETAWVTLHVGLGTFAPVKTAEVEAHRMHEEVFVLSADTAATVASARREGRRVVAVGTTVLRVLEHLGAVADPPWAAQRGRTRIFIHPPYRFRVVDALVTNFHLPESTLLMLVSAFADPGGTEGRALMLEVYADAVRERYRFFSYGDAMFIH